MKDAAGVGDLCRQSQKPAQTARAATSSRAGREGPLVYADWGIVTIADNRFCASAKSEVRPRC